MSRAEAWLEEHNVVPQAKRTTFYPSVDDEYVAAAAPMPETPVADVHWRRAITYGLAFSFPLWAILLGFLITLMVTR